MHQDSLQLQACQNPLDDQKRKSQDRDTLKSSLIDALRHVDQKFLIFREHFGAITLSLDRNDKHLWNKRPTFQNNPHMERDASI